MNRQTTSEKALGTEPAAAPPPSTINCLRNEPVNGVHSHRRAQYSDRLGMSRTFSSMSTKRRRIIIITLALFLLILIIGLAAGLSKRAHAVALPLPGPGNHTGALTYYDPGMGACGYTSSANQSVLAIGHATFDAVPNGGNPNRSPLCGKQIRVSRVSQNGSAASVTATVVDRCVGCGPTDLDVTLSVFVLLADMDQGRVQASWEWL